MIVQHLWLDFNNIFRMRVKSLNFSACDIRRDSALGLNLI